jgi:preprotein translocase subunit SecA
MFEQTIDSVQEEVARIIYRVQLQPQPQRPMYREMAFSGGGGDALDELRAAASPSGPGNGSQRKVGRNDPCPCGSGKKYKKCCGA